MVYIQEKSGDVSMLAQNQNQDQDSTKAQTWRKGRPVGYRAPRPQEARFEFRMEECLLERLRKAAAADNATVAAWVKRALIAALNQRGM